MADFIGKTIPRSKKEHVCNYCSQRIKKGERYERSRLAYDGSAYTWKNHIHCNKLAHHFDMFDNLDEGLTGDDFLESIMEIYRDDHRDEKSPFNIQKMIDYCIKKMDSQNSGKEVSNV